MLARLLLLATLSLLTHALDGRQYPETQRSQGFVLIANVTDPAKDIFDPPINHWHLGSWRLGLVVATARVANESMEKAPIWFLNGTAEQVKDRSTSIHQPPQSSSIVSGLQYRTKSWSKRTGNSAEVRVNFKRGEPGGGIASLPQSPYPTLFPPAVYGSHKFMACNEGERAQWDVRYAVRIGDVIPADCVEITLLAQCATLPLPLLEDSVDGPLNWVVQEVDCYPDVAAIDWTMY